MSVVELAGVTHIYFGKELVRSLVLDPAINYRRATGKPRPSSERGKELPAK